MSDRPSDQLSSGCLHLLLEVLQKERGKGSQWVPTLLTMARVLVNYGQYTHIHISLVNDVVVFVENMAKSPEMIFMCLFIFFLFCCSFAFNGLVTWMITREHLNR